MTLNQEHCFHGILPWSTPQYLFACRLRPAEKGCPSCGPVDSQGPHQRLRPWCCSIFTPDALNLIHALKMPLPYGRFEPHVSKSEYQLWQLLQDGILVWEITLSVVLQVVGSCAVLVTIISTSFLRWAFGVARRILRKVRLVSSYK